MIIIGSILVGLLYASALYLLMARSSVKLIFGLLLIGHAANLLIFSAGGWIRAQPPIVSPDASAPSPGHADPLPQALILTAIVISFSVLAFASVLVRRACHVFGTDEIVNEGDQP